MTNTSPSLKKFLSMFDAQREISLNWGSLFESLPCGTPLHMGYGHGKGGKMIEKAVCMALDQLPQNMDYSGIMIDITGNSRVGMEEITRVFDMIPSKKGIYRKLGLKADKSYGEEISVFIIAA